ncbi:unnamed protein product [Soboliphyme baturini]|uniref:CDI domain-containing protein n=1 Tax=Soboliphyme baturini TaxID=241478 RepID=A0A183IBU6_9BILA|nr:unnamed protein product [Soboliphyme baturini]
MQLSVCGAGSGGSGSELWTTATSTAAGTAATSATDDLCQRRRVVSVRRNLFGSNDELVVGQKENEKAMTKKKNGDVEHHDESEKFPWIEEVVRRSSVEVLKQCRQWCFDFVNDRPMTDGDYEWIKLSVGQVPSYYACSTPIDRRPRAHVRRRSQPSCPPHPISVPLPLPTPVSTSSSLSQSPCMTEPSTSTAAAPNSSADILQNLAVSFERTPYGKGGKCRYSTTTSAFPSLSSARTIRQTHLTDFFTVRKRPLNLDKLSASSDDSGDCMYASYDASDYSRSVKIVEDAGGQWPLPQIQKFVHRRSLANAKVAAIMFVSAASGGAPVLARRRRSMTRIIGAVFTRNFAKRTALSPRCLLEKHDADWLI